jgi:hypothetical protein
LPETINRAIASCRPDPERSAVTLILYNNQFACIAKTPVSSGRQHMVSNTTKPQRGGVRPSAGYPAGSLNQREVVAIERVAQQFPGWSPLLHFATIANDETLDPSIRLDAAKAAAPFYHPRPKPVERDPEALVDLEGKLAQVRNAAKGQSQNNLDGLAERLERASRRCDDV